MGAEYYNTIFLQYKTKDGYEDRISIESSLEYYSFHFDSDIENDFEIQKEKFLKDVSPEKLLYENGKWIITSSSKIDYYKKLIMNNNHHINNFDDEILSIKKCIKNKETLNKK